MLKVSVIVSAYNMEEYIDKCVKSVLTQSFRDFELILINDGSFDKTGAICHRYAELDERVVHISKPNEGLSISRNKGIKMARGEYVTFLDADDWLHPDYIEKLVESAEQNEADIVISDLCYVSQTDEGFVQNFSAIRLPNGKADSANEKNFFGRCRTFLCGKLFRKELFFRYDVWLPGHNYEDISVVPYLISKAGVVSHQPGTYYYYFRNREGSIINDFKYLPSIRTSLNELIDRFVNDGSFEAFRIQLMNLCWGQVCNVYNLTNSRFSDEDSSVAAEIREDVLSYFLKVFSEGERLTDLKYYVTDEVLRKAVRHIVLSEDQMVEDKNIADIIVGWAEEAECVADGSKVIRIKRDVNEDAETQSWNAADELFWSLFI